MSRTELELLIEETLVWKLYRDGCWGKGHHSQTPLFTKGFPGHVSGQRVEKVADSLLKHGILYCRASGHEYQWSLNPEKKGQIELIVERRRKRLGLV